MNLMCKQFSKFVLPQAFLASARIKSFAAVGFASYRPFQSIRGMLEYLYIYINCTFLLKNSRMLPFKSHLRKEMFYTTISLTDRP